MSASRSETSSASTDASADRTAFIRANTRVLAPPLVPEIKLYLAEESVPLWEKTEDKFLVRFVGWGAGHDLGEKWLSEKQKLKLVSILKRYGSVYISSEMPLPNGLAKFACNIPPSDIHGFMKTCKMIVVTCSSMLRKSSEIGYTYERKG